MKWPSFTFEHIIISACCVKNEKEKLNIMFTGATDISGEKCRSNGDIENVRLKTSPKKMVFYLSSKHTHTHRTHIHTHAHTCVHIYTCAHICARVCSYTYIPIHRCTHTE